MPTARTPTPYLAALLLALAATVALAFAWPAAADARTVPVKVMTRNIYLGADLVPAFSTQSREEFEREAGEIFRTVQETDFPARSELLADEIAATRPHLIGLQEASLWRRDENGGDQPATTVVYDYLRILQRALRERGVSYRAVVVQREADIEVPTNLGHDVRLTMRDVILVRRGSGVRIRRRLRGHFDENLRVTTPVGTFTSLRGWTAVDASRRGVRFRFVNTHLEAFGDAIRAEQARELTRGPLDTRGRVILVGDVNSDPADEDEAADAYNVLDGSGLRDAWTIVRRAAGYTSGFDEFVMGDLSALERRIDVVMFRGRVVALSAIRVGDDPDNRTDDGMWPSDHAGVVARLGLRTAARGAPVFTGRAGR